MKAVNKFFVEIHKANKQFVIEAWEDWQVYVADNLKAETERLYPEGFKDFLVGRLELEIAKAKGTK